ncbi:MAG: DUF3127 domain-containing protein [Pirellulaceae bacterium]|nr:DUF3127 domain-containing protein [Pirellulaceae bacterium]
MSDPIVRGIVHVVEETKTYGRNDFRKRLVVLEQDTGRFPNYVPVHFIQEGCDSVDQLNVGDEVDITYRLSGRKWQRDEQSEVKFFLNAEGSKFTVVNKAGTSAGDSPAPSDTVDPFAMVDSDEEAPF